MTREPLFPDKPRTDPTPMRRSDSPTGYMCPECLRPLTADWSGEHEAACVLGRLREETDG